MPLSRITNPFLSVSGAGSVSITSPSANTIAFTTGGTEDMRINPTGNVGIGTTTPNFQLSFGANIGKTIAVFENAGTSVYGIGMGGAGTGGDPYRTKLFANGTEYASITDAGLFTVVGGQIKFPATQNATSDANTLDDYEEGTFTPNLVNNGTSSTFSAKDGWYRKIGSQITYWVRFDGGNSGTAGTTLQIVNLPFTFLSGTAAAQVGGVFSSNNAGVPTGSVNPQGNTNYAYIFYGGSQQTAQATYLSATIVGMTNS